MGLGADSFGKLVAGRMEKVGTWVQDLWLLGDDLGVNESGKIRSVGCLGSISQDFARLKSWKAWLGKGERRGGMVEGMK